MAREGLRYKLNTALHQALKQQKTITSEGLEIKHNNTLRIIDLVVRPMTESTFSQAFMLVIFDEKTSHQPVQKNKKAAKDSSDPYLLGLEQELLSTRALLDADLQAAESVIASDIDIDAIEFARAAIYPDSIAADVSPARLDRFFLKENDAYRVRKQIRDMIIFAPQNLIKDPPFSRLNLISCRNLLIYMEPVLQKKLLPLFHYTLVPN